MKRSSSSRALLALVPLAALLTLSLLAGCRAPRTTTTESRVASPQAPAEDPGEDPRLDAARRIMVATRYCALITVDEAGRPRARTVDPRPPDESMVVYLVTQPLTRKVKQIEANPEVTLYYADPTKAEYVTVMGTATLTRDPLDIELFWHPEWDEYYPNRPEDTVLIRVVPSRIEVLSRDLEPDPVTWQPQGVELGSSP